MQSIEELLCFPSSINTPNIVAIVIVTSMFPVSLDCIYGGRWIDFLH
jgi:hypothetical protein